MAESPQAKDSAYLAAMQAWFELPSDADLSAHQAALTEIGRREEGIGRLRAALLRRDAVASWWMQSGLCGYCGEKVSDLNVHLGHQVISKRLSMPKPPDAPR